MKNDFAFYILLASCAAWFFLRRHKPRGEYSADLADRINRIAYINKQIGECEDLLTEIKLTDLHQVKNIPLHWQTVAGVNHKADIFISGDGGEVTRKLVDLTKARRRELITSLFTELSKLPLRRFANVTQTTAENGRNGRGEGA